MECWHCDADLTSKPIQMKILPFQQRRSYQRKKLFILCLECWKLAIHECHDLDSCEHCGPNCICIVRSMATISYRLNRQSR